MKQFSSPLIITNSESPLNNAVITTSDDGTIISVNNTPDKKYPVEFHNGIIIPGFVNCHCHLEISHLGDTIKEGQGLAYFIREIRNNRDNNTEKIISGIEAADREMYNEGIVLCADICNTAITFGFKKESQICYYNLLEVFGIDPEKLHRRIAGILEVEAEAIRQGVEYSLTPHSAYSVSLSLFGYLKEKTKTNKVTSIHFLESEEERQFLYGHAGPLRDTYEKSGLMPEFPETPADHTTAVLNEVTGSGNLILVHNTFADRDTVREVKRRKNTFWCLCPGSNTYISNKLPPADILVSEGCSIVIGTDSLASNNKLSILTELKILQKHFPSFSLEELIRWATINGATALAKHQNYGSIEPGKKPGLLLLENIDMTNMKLLPESSVKRLM